MHPGEPKTLASVYDPSSPMDLLDGSGMKASLVEQGKAFAVGVGAIAVGLLVVWFLARWIYIAWKRTNESVMCQTVLGRLSVRVGSPVLLCVAVATVIGLVIRGWYVIAHPQW